MGFLPHWSDFGIIHFPSYVLGAILIVLLPGPNSLYVLALSAERGWKKGLWASAGILVGDAIIMLSVALGAATVLASSPLTYSLLRLLGAGYLAWLGFSIIRVGIARFQVKGASAEDPSLLQAGGIMRLHPFLGALLVALTNPKAIFFFISFFTQFVDADFHQPALGFFYLAVVTQLINVVYLAILIGAGQYCLSLVKANSMIAAGLWLATGILFIGFSLRLLLELLE
jgi:leucine efflux protein